MEHNGNRDCSRDPRIKASSMAGWGAQSSPNHLAAGHLLYNPSERLYDATEAPFNSFPASSKPTMAAFMLPTPDTTPDVTPRDDRGLRSHITPTLNPSEPEPLFANLYGSTTSSPAVSVGGSRPGFIQTPESLISSCSHGSSTSIRSKSSVDSGYYSKTGSASSYSSPSMSNCRVIDDFPKKKRMRSLWYPLDDGEDALSPFSPTDESCDTSESVLGSMNAARAPSAVSAFSEAEISALRVLLAKQADAHVSQFLDCTGSKCTPAPTPAPGPIEAVAYTSPISCKHSYAQGSRKTCIPAGHEFTRSRSEADSDDDDDTSDDEGDQPHHLRDALDEHIEKLTFFRLLNRDAESRKTQLLAHSSPGSASGSSTFSNNATPSSSITSRSDKLSNSPPERVSKSPNGSKLPTDLDIGVGSESILKQTSLPLPLVCWHAAVGIPCKLHTGRNTDTRRLFE